MDTWVQLLAGFQVALTLPNLMWCLVGCALGTAVGVLPGVGPAVTVALLLPITTKVDASGALIMFAGIYYGAMYGGSTTSILINSPGETAPAKTGGKSALDGRARPRAPVAVNITAAVHPGDNVVALRVDHTKITDLALGGILRPVLLSEKVE